MADDENTAGTGGGTGNAEEDVGAEDTGTDVTGTQGGDTGGGESGTDAGGTDAGDSHGRGGAGGGEQGYTPPTEVEWRRVQDALSSANREAKKFRLELRDIRKAQEVEKRKGETEHEAALREAAEKAAAEKEGFYKPLVVRGAAAKALYDANVVLTDPAGKPLPGRLDKILGLLKLDQLEVDPDGTVVGLDDQIKEIRAGFPEFFTKPAPRARQTADAADKRPEPSKKRTTAEQLADLLGPS